MISVVLLYLAVGTAMAAAVNDLVPWLQLTTVERVLVGLTWPVAAVLAALDWMDIRRNRNKEE